LHERQDTCLDRFFGQRPSVPEQDRSIAGDHIDLRDTIDPKINGCASWAINANVGVWITVATQEAAGRGRVVLVVDAEKWDAKKWTIAGLPFPRTSELTLSWALVVASAALSGCKSNAGTGLPTSADGRLEGSPAFKAMKNSPARAAKSAKGKRTPNERFRAFGNAARSFSVREDLVSVIWLKSVLTGPFGSPWAWRLVLASLPSDV
jgi:hypothetical protein